MKCIEGLSVGRRRVLVVACGGAADLILAKAVAGRAVHAGAALVDLLQPIGGALDGEKIRRYGSWDGLALTSLGSADPGLVLRHEGVVPNPMLPMKVRGKGIRISAVSSDSKIDPPHDSKIDPPRGLGLGPLAGLYLS